MKNLRIIFSKALLVSALATGMFVTGIASADTTGLTPDSSGAIFFASMDYKGVHPSKPHVVYERQVKEGQLVRAEGKQVVPLADFSGKPPFKRHTEEQHLEKVQFARFEESAGATTHQHDIYRGSQGIHPPYKRNW